MVYKRNVLEYSGLRENGIRRKWIRKKNGLEVSCLKESESEKSGLEVG